MTQFLILYAIAGVATIGALTFMLHMIGQALADCPRSGRAARVCAMTIGTAFVAIGLGAMAFGVLPILDRDAGLGHVFGTFGTLLMGLGFGFVFAVTQLRQTVLDAAAAAAAPQAEPPGDPLPEPA